MNVVKPAPGGAGKTLPINRPLVFGAIALVAIVAVVVFVKMRKPAASATAAAAPAV